MEVAAQMSRCRPAVSQFVWTARLDWRIKEMFSSILKFQKTSFTQCIDVKLGYLEVAVYVWRLSTQAPPKWQTISWLFRDKLDRADSPQDRSSSLRGACRAHRRAFFLLRWIVSESSLGLLLLIGFITVKRSGMRGKSSVIRVCRYPLLPPIERKPRPSDALEVWRWGEKEVGRRIFARNQRAVYCNCIFITN